MAPLHTLPPRGARTGYVLAFMVAVGGGGTYFHSQDMQTVHEAEQLAAARTRYEDLQQHCIERELDKITAPRSAR